MEESNLIDQVLGAAGGIAFLILFAFYVWLNRPWRRL